MSETCPHFGTCGGCQLFGLDQSSYLAAKRQSVADALASHRIEPMRLNETMACPPRTRRRAAIKLWQDDDGRAHIGFSAERSHNLVPIETCLVLHPELLGFARRLAATMPPRTLSGSSTTLLLTLAREGVDVDIATKPPLSATTRGILVKTLRELHAVRITHGGEMLHQSGPPYVVLDEVPVRLPPRPFLQAVPQAEAAMTACIMAIVKNAKRVADLFAGLGTFSLPLSRHHEVHAVEGDADAAAALKEAAANLQGRKRLTVTCRDLFHRALLPDELSAYDAIVLDPPFQGAREQCALLAKAKARRIAYVSCNPASFARDAAMLVAGGWRLDEVTPIDQFLWSRQVELVAGFTRAG